MVDLSGPCFTSTNDVIECRFAKKYVSRGYRVNVIKARCPVPLMNTRGWIPIEVSVNGENYQFGNEILIGTNFHNIYRNIPLDAIYDKII